MRGLSPKEIRIGQHNGKLRTIGGRCLELAFPSQAAARAFAIGIGEPVSVDEFLVLGFREV
jgi:hypothetical protein